MDKRLLYLCMVISLLSKFAWSKVPEYKIQLKDHLFYPSSITIEPGIKVKLIIENQDDTPEEFDSFSLNREKVIFANGKTSIFVGPLQPGEYDFFGEYNPNTARGKVIVKKQDGQNVN
jgi:plastocyanin